MRKNCQKPVFQGSHYFLHIVKPPAAPTERKASMATSTPMSSPEWLVWFEDSKHLLIPIQKVSSSKWSASAKWDIWKHTLLPYVTDTLCLFVEPEETISQSFSVIVLLANINLGKQNTPGTVGPTSMNKYVMERCERQRAWWKDWGERESGSWALEKGRTGYVTWVSNRLLT